MTRELLKGRGVVGGVATGEALVTSQPISGWGGIDPLRGVVIESRHELKGQSIAGRVLVFPGAKGSSGWSGMFHMARLAGTAPVAMVFNKMNTKIALGVVVTRVPAVTDLDRDPIETIRNGDLVRVDGDNGVVEVLRRARDDAEQEAPEKAAAASGGRDAATSKGASRA